MDDAPMRGPSGVPNYGKFIDLAGLIQEGILNNVLPVENRILSEIQGSL